MRPAIRTRLRPIRSPTTPKVNSRPAKTSVYELIAHSSSDWLAPMPPLAAGLAIVFSATLSTVLSMTMASRPTTTTPRMTHRLR